MPESTHNAFVVRLLNRYEHYREPALVHRRFRHRDILPLLEKLRALPGVAVHGEGRSTEGRDIFRIEAGHGATPVLMWSQMHGDEPTATMALFDLLNFLTADDEWNGLRMLILDAVTLHVIPMLNPDAAERFQRHTPWGVDLNRDALRLQAPESRLLKRVRDELGAEFGFNLHDQSTRYSAGTSPESTIIAFLAPPVDAESSVTAVRRRSMQLIAALNQVLQTMIPDRVAAYSDEFEPRAFGDNIQKWGTSTILVESGGLAGDPEKQHIRKINFLILLESLRQIATKAYETVDIAGYYDIPPNLFRMYDTIFRGAGYHYREQRFELDIAINRDEIETGGAGGKGFYLHGTVADTGDLSTFCGYQELDASELTVVPGKICPDSFSDLSDLGNTDPLALIRRGYTAVSLDRIPDKLHTDYPLNIVKTGSVQPTGTMPGTDANLLFYRGDDVVYSVINGTVTDVAAGQCPDGNALVYPQSSDDRQRYLAEPEEDPRMP
ncbi:M14 family zinc carboxypeptidase [Balneolales bacterium ANBcel1]|nr:M14 family zinc carboxypeptidase [Balneolales bacterium ANBcel1]